MAKLTLTDLTSIIGAETSAIAAINANGALIEAALENTLSRDGTTPNTMSSDLDMNTNDVNNVGTLRTTALTVNGNAISTAGMDWKGAWVTTTVYAVDEGVSNNGSSYICIAAHTAGATDDEPGVGATTATYWNQFAAKGATGAAGSTTIADDEFLVVGSADATKKLAFEVDGITTATTRTWTVPDIDITFGALANTILNTASEAAFKTALNLEAGTDYNAYHALLNDIAGLTLTDGDILYSDGTNIVKLDSGTAGQVLQSNGVAAPSWVTAGGKWVTSQAEYEPGALPSYVAEGLTGRTQQIIFSLKPVTDNVDLYLTVGHSAGPTYLASTVYEYGGVGWSADNNNREYAGQAKAQIQLNHPTNSVGNAANEWVSGTVTIYDFDETEYSHITATVTSRTPADDTESAFIGGTINYATNALTAIKLAFSSGNIAEGYMTVLKLD